MAIVCMDVMPRSAELSGVHTSPVQMELLLSGWLQLPILQGRGLGTASSCQYLGTAVTLAVVYLVYSQGQSAEGNLKCQCKTELRKINTQALSTFLLFF